MERPMEVLLIEDEALDAMVTKRFLKQTLPDCNLTIIGDGEEALDFLTQRRGHEKAPRPDLVLLDVGLPGMDGRDLLERVKLIPDLNSIPIVILTGESLVGNPVKEFRLHENCYVNKWVDMKQLMSLIKSVNDYRQTFQQNRTAA